MKISSYAIYSIKREVVRQILQQEKSRIYLYGISFLISDKLLPEGRQILLLDKLYIKPVVIRSKDNSKKSLPQTNKSGKVFVDLDNLVLLEDVKMTFSGFKKEYLMPLGTFVNPNKLKKAYHVMEASYVLGKKADKAIQVVRDFEDEIGSQIGLFITELEANLSA